MLDDDSSVWRQAVGRVVQPGDVIDGKYRVVRAIGRGGMGVVMEAWHLQLEERVAMKFLLPALGANEEANIRFDREARALFKIKSEHVCRVLDVGRLPDGSPYMAMEFLDGSDLASRLADRQGMPVAEAVGYVIQACEAVAEAHCRGIVHRDIKPENLFLARCPDGSVQIKVLDFGLSKEQEPTDNTQRRRALTAEQQVMGTPSYMSPEQWMSTRDVGPAADQWALATILYELCAGVPPFEGEQLAHICSKVLNAPMPPLAGRVAGCSPALDVVLGKALEKSPRDRYHHLGGFAMAISAFGTEEARVKAARIVRTFEQADELLRSMEGLAPRASDFELAAAPRPHAVSSPVAGAPVVPPTMAAPAVSGDVPPPRRSTMQTWQTLAGPEGPSRAKLALVAAAGLLCGGLLVAAALSRADLPDGKVPAASAPAVTAEAAPEDSSPVVHASSSAGATASATGSAPSAKPAATPAPRPRHRPRPAPKATGSPTSNRKKPDIFSGR